jgi:signal transduction histidine kinase
VHERCNNPPARWDVAAEAIAVRMRWFGVILGVALVETRAAASQPVANLLGLRTLLALGAVYAAIDTYYSLRGRVWLQNRPLIVSLLEAVFIGLLCHFDLGIDSLFRFYYMMSLVSCAIRYDRTSTYLTCLLHSASYSGLAVYDAVRVGGSPFHAGGQWSFALTIVVMFWVTWASSALAGLLKRAQEDLQRLNRALKEQQGQLQDRIADRTRELQEAQASLLHQEKMAAFGLLAAGIAHEVGNPLASISSLVQMLARRHTDPYTQEKLALVEGQLTRIQGTLRELVDFSRPATRQKSAINLNDAIDEALHIAKYYKRTKSKTIESDFAADLPPVQAVSDQLVQLFLNLALNAIDATDKNGRIQLSTRLVEGQIEARVRDDGHGIRPEDHAKVFQPYYTTKDNGTGLGLFVSRKIVADLGGTIDFASTPGQGTTFVVRLPFRTAPSPVRRGNVAPAPTAASAASSETSALHVRRCSH